MFVQVEVNSTSNVLKYLKLYSIWTPFSLIVGSLMD